MQIKTETIVGIFIVIALGIFFYLSFFLGVFRIDRVHYQKYTVYFNDVSGLDKKADVKIAGVKVGWVEKIELIENHEYQAKANIMVLKRYILHNNAHAIVRQEGLLGPKYLEVVPGDPLLPSLSAGGSLGGPGRAPVPIDEILYKVNTIASNVEDVTNSLRSSFGGPEGQHNLNMMIQRFQEAAEKIAAISSVLDRTLSNNEDNINVIIHDFRDFMRDIKENFPAIKGDIDRVAQVLDRDISRVANKLESTSRALEEAALFARDGFKHVGDVAEKINDGKGVLGKLVNEEEMYNDMKTTIQGVKNYLAKMDSVSVVLDAHNEFMYRYAEHVLFQDSKGYFDIRLHQQDDKFYLLQLMSSQKGRMQRRITNKLWYDENGKPLLTNDLFAAGIQIPELIGTIEVTDRILDQYKFGFQFGKIFKDVALRFGLFENTVGAAVDFDIPFGTDKFRWVTSMEIFDFRGRDRINDNRPHLKWINRLFFMRNLYFNFGADDFISRHNANGFFGVGVRFTDDDIKYFITQIGLLGLGATAS